MSAILEHLQRSFRVADAADIALVSVLMYAVLMWIRSTASKQVLLGFVVLGGVYALARTFDLYMTTAMFRAVLAFAAIAAIVVFQEDLRRAFAGLASIGKPKSARTHTTDVDLDVLVEIVFELAKKRIGAIVVLQGVEQIDRHVRGGVEIDAKISKALLDSIFDPHSMGHDGAVIIHRDRLSKFAARLPLSDNGKVIGSRGTRHSAALGLTELSDALVLVVSEERGEVGLAERGKLEVLENAVDLRARLERFTHRVRPGSTAGPQQHFIRKGLGLKLGAVAAAFISWVMVTYETETVQKTFVVPIEYRNLSDRLDIDDSAPTEAKVTLAGYERSFSLLAPSTLRVSLDLSKVEEGPQQITIDESSIKLPAKLSLFRSAPRIVSFGVHTWVNSRLVVEPRTQGRLPLALRQREVFVTPSSVQVTIWRSHKEENAKVFTDTIDLSKLADGVEMSVKLALPEYMKLAPDQPSEVRVQLDAPATKQAVEGERQGPLHPPGRSRQR